MEQPRSSSAEWRRLVGRVAGANSRDHIESALRAYVASWADADVGARLALFADDIVIEDPVTLRHASNKAEMSAFVSLGIPSDWDMTFTFDRVAVVGDHALLTYRIALRAGDATPAELLVNAHVEFGADGLINSYRTFFDADSITEHGSRSH